MHDRCVIWFSVVSQHIYCTPSGGDTCSLHAALWQILVSSIYNQRVFNNVWIRSLLSVRPDPYHHYIYTHVHLRLGDQSNFIFQWWFRPTRTMKTGKCKFALMLYWCKGGHKAHPHSTPARGMFASAWAMNPLILLSLAVMTKHGQRWLCGNGVKGQSFPPWCGYQSQLLSQHCMYTNLDYHTMLEGELHAISQSVIGAGQIKDIQYCIGSSCNSGNPRLIFVLKHAPTGNKPHYCDIPETILQGKATRSQLPFGDEEETHRGKVRDNAGGGGNRKSKR